MVDKLLNDLDRDTIHIAQRVEYTRNEAKYNDYWISDLSGTDNMDTIAVIWVNI